MAIDTVDTHQVTEAERWPAARWLAAVVFWIAVAALALSIVGLFLAVAGFFRPVWVIALGLPATIGLGVWGWHPFRRAASEHIHGGVIPVTVVVVVIVAADSQ